MKKEGKPQGSTLKSLKKINKLEEGRGEWNSWSRGKIC